MRGLPPKPAGEVFEVHISGQQQPMRTNKLVEAQWRAKDAAKLGKTATIIDGITGAVIERHEPKDSA